MAKNKVEDKMISALDRLAEFEEFSTEIAPLLRKLLKDGVTAEDIEKNPRVQALLVARQLSIALRETDASKAMGAIKDIRDRTQGKATEKVEVTSKVEALSDEQLDALLHSKLALSKDEDELPN